MHWCGTYINAGFVSLRCRNCIHTFTVSTVLINFPAVISIVWLKVKKIS